MSDLGPRQYNPSSPAGQIESSELAAARLIRLRGWRRQVARWGVIAMAAALVALFVVSALHH